MKRYFNLGGFSFSASARFVGVVNNAWDGDSNKHNKFTVTVCSDLGRCSFSFFDSFANYAKGVVSLDRSGLLGAIDCLFSDASCYDCCVDFDDFCKELGYTSISEYKEARKAFNGCKKASASVCRVFGSYSDAVRDALYDL